MSNKSKPHPHVPPVHKPHPKPVLEGAPMASAILVSVVNHSKYLTEQETAKMTAAIALQGARDVAKVYPSIPGIEYVPPGAKSSNNASPCDVTDNPDVPGAGGYHDEGENGIPYIKVFNLDRGIDGTSVTLSHEYIELSQDSAANKWADTADGSDVAWELCDAVEGDIYIIGGVQVSNFVYPAWFDPKSGPDEKFDHLGLLKAPFTMTPNGYMIVRTEEGKISQVFASHAKRHPDCDVREVPGHPGLHLVFGRDYPEHKKSGKILKAARRRGKKAA